MQAFSDLEFLPVVMLDLQMQHAKCGKEHPFWKCLLGERREHACVRSW